MDSRQAFVAPAESAFTAQATVGPGTFGPLFGSFQFQSVSIYFGDVAVNMRALRQSSALADEASVADDAVASEIAAQNAKAARSSGEIADVSSATAAAAKLGVSVPVLSSERSEEGGCSECRSGGETRAEDQLASECAAPNVSHLDGVLRSIAVSYFSPRLFFELPTAVKAHAKVSPGNATDAGGDVAAPSRHAATGSSLSGEREIDAVAREGVRAAKRAFERGAALAAGMRADESKRVAEIGLKTLDPVLRSASRRENARDAASDPAILEGLLNAGGPSIYRWGMRAPVQERIVERVSASWDQLLVDVKFGDQPVREYYVEHDGRVVFAGFEPMHSGQALTPVDVLTIAPMLPWMQPAGLPGTFALGQPGGEGAYKYPSDEVRGPSVEERLMAHVMEQLAAGSVSLETGDVLDAVNALLAFHAAAGAADAIERDEWEFLLQLSLRFAVGAQPVFDAAGARGAAAIRENAASVLGISAESFDVWENHFGVESISDQIFFGLEDLAVEQDSKPIVQDLALQLKGQIAIAANIARTHVAPHAAIGQAEELVLQWRLAGVAIIPGRADQMRAMLATLTSFKRRNVHLAGRALALIFANSELNGRPAAEEPLFKRSSKATMQKLITKLMGSDAWDMVSHRSFRMHLTPEGNAAVNAMIEHANYDSAVERIGRIDVAEPGALERMERILSETGRLGAVYDEIMRHMVIRVGALPPDMLEGDE